MFQVFSGREQSFMFMSINMTSSLAMKVRGGATTESFFMYLCHVFKKSVIFFDLLNLCRVMTDSFN